MPLISLLTASGKALHAVGEPHARSRNSQRGGSAISKATSQSTSHCELSICNPLEVFSSMLDGLLPVNLQHAPAGQLFPQPVVPEGLLCGPVACTALGQLYNNQLSVRLLRGLPLQSKCASDAGEAARK
eukprot:CAMPEP_0169163408 /NCGR_PEP_ID=MMETSP1015-20121227/58251_1 /TAXON_ID=342587 /ORGANISM="Karlodinium micrum, Strain CCMP2283" /LENGTH=128 /DNA_ID=CAMNT_0009235707 /DNA_START=930 /DNA_END=1316 /DNA_ORIENTATION=+